MKNLIKRIRSDNRGSTMIEAVTTIFIMTIVLPVIVIMMSAALNSRTTADSISSNTINAVAVQNSLNNDIETASAVQIVNENVLNLRSQEGLCKTWKIKDGSLVRASSNTAITDTSNWLTSGEHFAPIDGDPLFHKDSVGAVGYNFQVGKAALVQELRGSAIQSSASSGSGACW